MKALRRLAVSLAVAAVIACRASLPAERTNAWLDSQAGTSTVNMTGTWDAGPYANGGWGEGNFRQHGNRFSGTLGPYGVDGVVNGDEVYLAMRSGRSTYTAHMTKTADGSFEGKYVSGAIIDAAGVQVAAGDTISMKKM